MRGRPGAPIRFVVLLALFVVWLPLAHLQGPRAAQASSRYRTSKTRVMPGMVLLRILDSKGPNRIRVLKINPAADLTFDVALANDKIPRHERTSSMASRRGAAAAVNGDYTIVPGLEGAGRPIHLFAEDARLVTSPLLWGHNFALSRDEKDAYIGHATLKAWLTQKDSGATWKVKAWNEAAALPGKLSAYTPAGGYSFRPPRRACAARLLPSGLLFWRKNQMGVRQDHIVDAVRCAYKRLPRRGGVVVAAPRGTREAKAIRTELARHEKVSLAWSAGWRGVLDAIGGNPALIQDGVITVRPCNTSYFCYRNPRTGVGITETGRILLVTVDGRQPGRSVGMTPVAFARLFRYLGATWAMNLDGGGSTTMWVKGKIVNRPSDGRERAVGSALLVLPGADKQEPEPQGQRAPKKTSLLNTVTDLLPPPPGTAPSEAACAALHDPASTGGLLDAMSSGALGKSARLPAALQPGLEVYEAQRSC